MMKNYFTSYHLMTWAGAMTSIMFASSLYAMTSDEALLVPVDRYSTVSMAATSAQINPLLTIVQVNFPTEVTTIGQAVKTTLRYSGYALVATPQQSDALKRVLSQTLPLVDRHIGPMSIHDILLVLVGKNVFTLKTDPIHRTVNFQLIHTNNVTHQKGHCV